MINIINSWSKALIVSVIIAVIIEMILPEGNNKKFIKIVLSLYIVFAIIQPIIKIKHLNINSSISNLYIKTEQAKTTSISIDTNSYVEKEYIKNLKDNITKSINEKGYNVLSLQISMETQDKKKYGQINGLDINMENNKNKQKEFIKTVNKVDINFSDCETKDVITDEEIINLKDYLESLYSIKKESIVINKK